MKSAPTRARSGRFVPTWVAGMKYQASTPAYNGALGCSLRLVEQTAPLLLSDCVRCQSGLEPSGASRNEVRIFIIQPHKAQHRSAHSFQRPISTATCSTEYSRGMASATDARSGLATRGFDGQVLADAFAGFNSGTRCDSASHQARRVGEKLQKQASGRLDWCGTRDSIGGGNSCCGAHHNGWVK